MIVAIVLALIGLFLIYLEFFIPGAIAAIAGVALIIASIIFFFKEDPSFFSILIYFILLIVGVIVACKIAIKQLKKSKRFYSGADQEGYQAVSFEKELIGQRGKALTDLKPSGHILVENQRRQAVSDTGYISAGKEVEIISGRGGHLVVKLIKEEPS